MLSTAHLCILQARCPGEPGGPLEHQLGCCNPWATFPGHRVNICMHIYAHIYIYISFGGGRRDLLLIERAGIWPISFNLNMETQHNLHFYKALFMSREPFNWLLLHNITPPSLPSPPSFSPAHNLLY